MNDPFLSYVHRAKMAFYLLLELPTVVAVALNEAIHFKIQAMSVIIIIISGPSISKKTGRKSFGFPSLVRS